MKRWPLSRTHRSCDLRAATASSEPARSHVGRIADAISALEQSGHDVLFAGPARVRCLRGSRVAFAAERPGPCASSSPRPTPWRCGASDKRRSTRGSSVAKPSSSPSANTAFQPRCSTPSRASRPAGPTRAPAPPFPGPGRSMPRARAASSTPRKPPSPPVRALQARGVSVIDVGCLQVNLHHHPRAFSEPRGGFRPGGECALRRPLSHPPAPGTGNWLRAAGALPFADLRARRGLPAEGAGGVARHGRARGRGASTGRDDRGMERRRRRPDTASALDHRRGRFPGRGPEPVATRRPRRRGGGDCSTRCPWGRKPRRPAAAAPRHACGNWRRSPRRR